MRAIVSTIILLLYVSVTSAAGLDSDHLGEHPRLFFRKGEEAQVNKTIRKKGNKYLLEAHYNCISIADNTLGLPPCKWPGEGHILATSREILRRVINLSYAYRTTGHYPYAKRAEEEMLNACMFPHWDPGHYLDTAEMLFAMAVGYDWLYDYLPEGSRAMIRESILRKGLLTADSHGGSSHKSTNNWNSVCNAGLVAGATAIFEHYPEEARHRVEEALKYNPIVLAEYAPDGAYPEGYSYWSYGTGYQVILLTILEENYGSCFGLDSYPGFMQTGYFEQIMCTPTGHCFSFSDSGDKALCNLMLFWFSNRLNDPSLVYLEKKMLEKGNVDFGIEDRFLPLMVLWASKQDLAEVPQPSRNVWHSAGMVPLFIYRSGWDSPEDSYLGVKGGKPSVSHGHMDSGEFYFEKGGVIWAKDMGGQSYGTFYKNNVNCWDFSQDGDRWGIWRNCSVMHNTLTVNDGRHLADAFTDITEIYDTPECKGCVVDMSQAMSLQLDSAVRKISLTDNDCLLTIEDNLKAKAGEDAKVYWNMTTCASAKIISGNEILLTSGKKSLRVVAEGPGALEPVILSTKSPFSWDIANPGTCRIGFYANLSAGESGRITVKLIYGK